MVKDVIHDAETRMKRSIEATREALSTIRTGVAHAALLSPITVDVYGSKIRVSEVATISVPEARTLMITPWDKGIVSDIEKAILTSELGLTPSSDGSIIRLHIPPLTEERRKELVKGVGKRVEEGKVAIRNIRRDANEMLKDLEKAKEIGEDDTHRGQEEIQKATDAAIKELDVVRAAKEKELMQV